MNILRVGGAINAVVVQLPDRANPGVVIQKDSIFNLTALINDAKVKLSEGDYNETAELVDECLQLLEGYCRAFESQSP